MNTLVIYDSRTHNTQQIAHAIVDELSSLPLDELAGTDAPAIYSFSEMNDEELVRHVTEADLIFLGSWNKRSTFSPHVSTRMNELLESNPELATQKHWAYFMTSGAVAAPYVNICKTKMCETLPQVSEVLGIFICQGKMGEHVLRKYESGKGHSGDSPEMLKLRIANWHEALNHPNDYDLMAARAWARNIYTAAEQIHA